jgi:hypothetical protein
MSLFDTLRTAYAVRCFSVVVMLLYLAILSPLWGSVLLWLLFVSTSDAVMTLFAFTVVLSVVPAWWFSRITAHHMAVDGQSFNLAFQSTFYPVAMKLSFLPVVGGYFERILQGKKPNPFREGVE